MSQFALMRRSLASLRLHARVSATNALPACSVGRQSPRQVSSFPTVASFPKSSFTFIIQKHQQRQKASFPLQTTVRCLATKRQKRSGKYQEPATTKDYRKPPPSSSSLKSRPEDWQKLATSTTTKTTATTPKLLLPNTDNLAQFRDAPSLLHDTPYTTLEELQRGVAVDNNNTTASSSSSSSDLSALADLYDPSVHLSATAPTDWSNYEAATPLWEEMAAWIGVAGRPLTVADYMRQCLTHPTYGYYTQGTSKLSSSSSTITGAASAGAPQDDFDVDEWDTDSTRTKTTTSDSNNDENLVIGAGGDFVTAPEMSQIFGECLGIWCMTLWQLSSARSTAWQWLEAGPGKGSLMADLIRFTYAVDKIRESFGNGCKGIHFIEQSPRLRQVQRETLVKDVGHLVNFEFPQSQLETETTTGAENKETKTTTGAEDKPILPVYWHHTLEAFQLWQYQNESHLTTFAICQEFLDALPVYAFEKTNEGWRERLVDIAMREDVEMDESPSPVNVTAPSANDDAMDKLKNQKKPRLRLVTAPEVTPAAKTLLRVDPETGLMPNEDPPAPIGTVVEVNPEGILLAQDLARIVDKQGGGALIIDYGQEGSHDSIRAFSRHEQVHFLSRPGQVDVTADVDFAALGQAVNGLELKGAQAFGPVGQGDFLMAMGAQDRAIHLIESENTSAEDAENIYQALVRLCDPKEMGERFKVLAIAKKKDDIFQPPGF